jgi:hypothetical protein
MLLFLILGGHGLETSGIASRLIARDSSPGSIGIEVQWKGYSFLPKPCLLRLIDRGKFPP